MRGTWIPIWLLGAMAAVAAACASSGPQLHTLGPDPLFEHGLQAYEARKWSEAIRAFERLVLEYPTHPRIQEARFRLADSYFGRKEYITAASEFARLATDYPAGEWADDARFKVCESYFRLSPRSELDQEYTRAAIDHCQSLIAYYPTSEFAERAQQIVVELRDKLAKKMLENAQFYYQRNAVDPAILYLEDVVREYPESSSAPKALLRLVQIYREIGYEEEAEEAKQRLLRDYPNTAEAQQAKAISLAGVP
jgi:outer membrane protein assembly factor BamD